MFALALAMAASFGPGWGGTLQPPAGFLFIVDEDGYYLVDEDGYYLVEPI